MLSSFLALGLLALTVPTSASSNEELSLAHIKRSDYAVPAVGMHRRHHTKALRRRKCKSGSSSVSDSSAQSTQTSPEGTSAGISVGSTDVGVSVGSSGAGASVGGSSSKLGRSLAWAMDDRLATLFASADLKTYYHWEHDSVAGLSDMKFFPMLWGTSKLNMFLDVMKGYSDNNLPEWIIGFNEPDLSMQGNMSPQDAASAWKQYIQPYAAKGVKLAAPQLSYNHDWYRSFFQACDGCTFDAIGMHWYGDVNKIDDFKNAVTSFWSEFKQHAPEMWITEYSVTASSGGSIQQVMQFAKESTAFVEGLDYVTLISWFGAWANNPDGYASSNGRFVNDQGQLTDIGKWWIS